MSVSGKTGIKMPHQVKGNIKDNIARATGDKMEMEAEQKTILVSDIKRDHNSTMFFISNERNNNVKQWASIRGN
tara:strand:+ start:218 stop:439 length:222 start_codon:yes stop_codon:yes gene_type:complete